MLQVFLLQIDFELGNIHWENFRCSLSILVALNGTKGIAGSGQFEDI